MKKILLSIICFLLVVFGVFIFLVIEDIRYRKDTTTSYEEKLKSLEKEIESKKEEVNSLKENNPRMNEYELWQKQVEKAKNY